MDDAVRDYIGAIDPKTRGLFDRIHRLIMAAYPDALVVLSYHMPTYRVGKRRLYVAAWKHGLSIYGWDHGHEAGFLARHPGLQTSKGTIKLPPGLAATIPDDDFRELIRAALDDNASA